MTYASAVKTILQADATLVALLPGGIYIYQETGRKGLNREQLIAWFAQNSPLMNAGLVIYEAEEQADNQVVGSMTSAASSFTLLFINDGNKGFNTLEQAAARAYTLLHQTRIPGAFQFLWEGTVKNQREALVENACTVLYNGKVYGLRRPAGVS